MSRKQVAYHMFHECSWCVYFCVFQLDKDERSDEESELEEEDDDDDKGEGEEKDEEGECCWERSKDALNAKLKMLNKSFVLNNLTNHRAAIVSKMRKARQNYEPRQSDCFLSTIKLHYRPVRMEYFFSIWPLFLSAQST